LHSLELLRELGDWGIEVWNCGDHFVCLLGGVCWI
jgi:hypothetical protein